MADDDAAAARALIACLDLTELKDGCTDEDVERLIGRARTPVGPVAAVCVWPAFVARCAGALAGSGIRVATVVNFPHGGEDTAAAEREAVLAVADGAEEIDMVVAWRRVASDPAFVKRQVAALKAAAGGGLLKAILETGELKEPKLVAAAARAAIAGGADFVKTSTGKTARGATPEAVAVMAETIREAGKGTGLKPSGGIRTLAEARTYRDIAEAALGAGWVRPETFRLGASGLLDDLLAHAEPAKRRRVKRAGAP